MISAASLFTQNGSPPEPNAQVIVAKVVLVESPSEMFLTTPALIDQKNSFHPRMNRFYRSTEPDSSLEWKRKDECAVFDFRENIWHRGVITDYCAPVLAEVYLKDEGRTIRVRGADLRKLAPEFKRYPNCIFQCHLAEISPPLSDWSGPACEFFSKELKKYNFVHIVKRGIPICKSQPILLWVRPPEGTATSRGTSRNWVLVNRLLVEAGYAIPTYSTSR